jgi:hypothetical protein
VFSAFFYSLVRAFSDAMSITATEAKRIASLVAPIYDVHLEKYSFKKYPAADYIRFKNAYSALRQPNNEIHDSLVWKWGHVGKLDFPPKQKALITKVETSWPDYVEFRQKRKPEKFSSVDTFRWWKEKLPSTAYITVAYITHLVHHAEPLPIIDQHNFRAMNKLLKDVRLGHAANSLPRTWADITELKAFMTKVLEYLPRKSFFEEFDRFLMMYGKSIKPRKPRKPRKARKP